LNVILSGTPVILSATPVILSATPVILSAAKDLVSMRNGAGKLDSAGGRPKRVASLHLVFGIHASHAAGETQFADAAETPRRTWMCKCRESAWTRGAARRDPVRRRESTCRSVRVARQLE
jgi:hypothetical protein